MYMCACVCIKTPIRGDKIQNEEICVGFVLFCALLYISVFQMVTDMSV